MIEDDDLRKAGAATLLIDETAERVREESRLCSADVCAHCATGQPFSVVQYDERIAVLEHPGLPTFPTTGIACAAAPIHLRWMILAQLSPGIFEAPVAAHWYEQPQPALRGRSPRQLVMENQSPIVFALVAEMRRRHAERIDP